MKKILLFSIGKAFGGAESVLLSTVGMLKGKADVYACVRTGTALHQRICEIMSPDRIFSFPFSEKSFIGDAKKLKKLCLCEKISVVHSHGLGAAVCASIAKTKGIKYVYTVHGNTDFDRADRGKIKCALFRRMENFAVRKSDCVIAVSQDIANVIAARNKKANIVCIYNGVDFDNIPTKDTLYSGGPARLMTMGRLDPVKNYKELIRSVKILTDSGYDIYLDIYGEGKERESLLELIASLGLDGRVSVLSFNAQAPKIICNYDFYVQPSLYETFGIALVEAMGAKVPVICSGVGGMREIVSDGESGFVIDGSDAYAISDAVKRAMLCGNLRKITEGAYMRKDDFSLAVMREKLENVYGLS
ncbi:MAG: glycosyltransferase [Eubacteriales bacterium]|nr:glycosyltransferase [Eubacteriales bacterium]